MPPRVNPCRMIAQRFWSVLFTILALIPAQLSALSKRCATDMVFAIREKV